MQINKKSFFVNSKQIEISENQTCGFSNYRTPFAPIDRNQMENKVGFDKQFQNLKAATGAAGKYT